MAKKRKAAKSKSKRVVKKVTLTPDTIVNVAVPKGVVPLVATDPVKGVVIIPVPAVKLKDKTWFERWFG